MVVTSFVRGVRGVFTKYPPLKNCLTYGTLFCSAELSQQIFLKIYTPSSQGKPTEELDTDKLKHLAILGYGVLPNLMTVWYKWLDTKYTSTANRVIVKKVFLDQTCLTIPILIIFFTAMAWFEGQQDITKEFREKFQKTYTTSCAFWLPAQALNFKLVPPQYRIAYNGACGFIWANLLCLLKREGEEEKQESKEE